MASPVQQKRKSKMPSLATLLLVIIVAVLLAYVALTWHGVTTLGSNQTLLLGKGQSTYFQLKDSKNVYSIFLENTSQYASVFYLSQVPVLTEPIVAFAVTPSQMVNISTNDTGNADLQVRLVAASGKNATIELTSIPSLFSVKVTPGVIVRSPASLYSAGNASVQPSGPGTAQSTSTTSTTTAGSTTIGSTATTTVASTTVQAGGVYADIAPQLANTTLGSLMDNFNLLYIKDRACTSSEYNTTFASLDSNNQIEGVPPGTQPVGIFSYTNMSQSTPTGITPSATQTNTNTYSVTYTASVPGQGLSGPILTFTFNSNAGTITGVQFEGSLFSTFNQTTLESTYGFQDGITGVCGAYIP